MALQHLVDTIFVCWTAAIHDREKVLLRLQIQLLRLVIGRNLALKVDPDEVMEHSGDLLKDKFLTLLLICKQHHVFVQARVKL